MPDANYSPGNVVTALGDAPNSPDLSQDRKSHVPALTDIGQAVQLVRSLQAENRERALKNTRIMEKYNSERPYNPAKLRADGLSWKTNFTTKPLSALVDKVVPRFTSAIRKMKYLTASQLPDRFPQAADKTELFRREISATCRNHPQWEELLTDISLEDILFGFCSAGWIDSYSWFPRFYNQDAFLVPQGTKHNARSAPVVCLRDSYLVHELFEMLQNEEAAKLAGWNVKNVVEALNNAVPNDLRSAETDYANYGRIYADLSRSSAILSSFTGAKTVVVWHVFIAEVDGHVTHVAFDDRSGKELFWLEKQFPSMADAAAFYSFQHGNGQIQGSKGIGRELYNMASVLDRARNEVVDRLQLSGKILLTCDEKEIKRFRMSVVGNAILIASGYQVQQQRIDGAVQPFFELDQFLTQLIGDLVGNSTPALPTAERIPKAAVDLIAQRQNESQDITLSRFLGCFARFMSTVQKRLCNPETLDKDAKEMQARLLAVLSKEELDYLANQPAVETVEDYSDMERQAIVLINQEGRGNPLYNQYELERQGLIAKIGADFANKVLLPQNDPTDQAENAREQQIELQLLQRGQQVPVSPRDNHMVHLDVLHTAVDSVIPKLQNDLNARLAVQSVTKHAIAHIQAAEQGGQQKQVLEYRNFFQKVIQTLQHLHTDVPLEQAGGPGTPGGQPSVPMTPVHEMLQVTYKDLPEDVKRQVEAKLGLTPSTLTPATTTTAPAAPAPAPQPPGSNATS
jgi:hypothetical protein